MSRKISTILLDAQTVLNTVGTVGIADIANSDEMAFYAVFSHASAAGVVLIETAPTADYSGTWAVLATITWAAIDKVHYAAVSTPLMCVRARISSAVTSGTVTVYMVANAT